MAIGKIRTRQNFKNQNFESVDDPVLRALAGIVGDKINERERAKVYYCYQMPPEVKEALENARIEKKTGKAMGRLMRVPQCVERFLDVYFDVENNKDWREDKKLHNHELIKPWII